jgi:ABC-type lipoprotein export system ATPase subunit
MPLVFQFMTKYISQVKFNLWGNVKDINFGSGLNIVSGTNGTGKTRLLQFIQEHNNNDTQIILSDGTFQTRISAFSPQRNASKVLAEQAMNLFRQDINATQNALNSFTAAIQNDGFQTLRSISEYFVYLTEDTIKSDIINPDESANKIKSLFELVIKKIFDFEISFELNRDAKQWKLFFVKNGTPLTPDQLSHGENAVIVLMCALIFGKDSADTFLIDEPETHLNWSLEEKLFEGLDWYCSEFNKQIITVTHSRVVFLDKYETKRQFFERQANNIVISDKPSEELIRQLAGDTVQLLQGITVKTKLVYVEDEASKRILDAICKKLNLAVEIQKQNNCENVKNISRAFKDRQVENAYFLIDGDNKPFTIQDRQDLHKNTIQLEKYCIENYLLDPGILQLYKPQDWETQLKSNINAIQVKSNPSIKPVQIALEKGTAVVDIIDSIDGSKVFEKLAETEGKKEKKYDFMVELINHIPNDLIFTTYFTDLAFLQN